MAQNEMKAMRGLPQSVRLSEWLGAAAPKTDEVFLEVNANRFIDVLTERFGPDVTAPQAKSLVGSCSRGAAIVHAKLLCLPSYGALARLVHVASIAASALKRKT